MKKILSVLLAAWMTVSISCAAFAQEAPEGIRKGGTLVVALPMSPATLDNFEPFSSYESMVMYQICDTLIEYDAEYNDYVPRLATEWSVSEDGLDYYFTLRDDVYFSNGRKLTAEDVKYSFDRVSQSVDDHIAQGYYAGTDVIDDTHLVVHTNEVCGPFLSYLALPDTMIIPREEVEAAGADWGVKTLIGSGPFVLDKLIPDESVTLSRNPLYWGEQPNLDHIRFVVMKDTNQMVNAVKTGEVDIATYLQGEAVGEAQKAGLLMTVPSVSIAHVRFNSQNGPTADPRVREALVKATDIDALVEGIYQYGEASRIYLPLPLSNWAYDASLEPLVPEYDPEGAKQLLKEAGYGDGLTLNLYISSTTNRNKMAQILQAYWEDVGVKLNIRSGTMSDWIGSVTGSWQKDIVNVYALSWSGTADPYHFLQNFYHSRYTGALTNSIGYQNPEVDALLNAAFSSIDTETRKELYRKVMEIVIPECLDINYANEDFCFAVSPKVHGFHLRTDAQMLLCNSYTNVWKER